MVELNDSQGPVDFARVLTGEAGENPALCRSGKEPMSRALTEVRMPVK